MLCVTLTRELDPKVSADIIKLFKRSTPETVYYCSSIRLTEDACIQLEASVRNLVNKPVSVRVLGSIQLADLSQKYEAILGRHYRSEIENIKAIFDTRQARLADRDARGLRMALMAYGSDDAHQLRENMSLQMILDALSLGETTEGSVAARITKDFSLPKGLSTTYIAQILTAAALKGLAVRSGQQWELTERGRCEVDRVPTEAAANLLEGRSVVRECLETLIGQKISDSQYEKTWMTLLDGFSELFHSNGIGIVSAVSSFLNQSDGTPTEDRDLPRLIAQISAKLKAIFASDELGSQVASAMKDMFTERDGKAFHWIAGVCERFVTMCSRGLEATASDEIKALPN